MTNAQDSLAGIDTAILAGGLGTRIRDVLGDTPKVLAPVENTPFLALLLDRLAEFGSRRVVMCLGHLADRVTAWLEEGQTPQGMEIVCRIEPTPMGTAGGLRHAADALLSDPVLVMNGDTFVDADLAAFVAAHRRSGALASILCVEVNDAARYGRVEIEDGHVQRFIEKSPGAGVINAGIYLFSRPFFENLTRSNAASLERDVLETLPPGTLHAQVIRGRFIDIGTPESLGAAADVILGAAR